MGMLLHNTLMEQEAAMRKAAEKPVVEVPKETKEPEAEPEKKPTCQSRSSWASR